MALNSILPGDTGLQNTKSPLRDTRLEPPATSRRPVYPFQVPAENVQLAQRGAPPRDHFCENTQEDGQDTVGSNQVWRAGQTAEPAGVEPAPVERSSNAVPDRADWEL